MSDVHGQIANVFMMWDTLKKRVSVLVGEIAGVYADRREGITIVTILVCLVIFLPNLIRQLPMRTKMRLDCGGAYCNPRYIADLQSEDFETVRWM